MLSFIRGFRRSGSKKQVSSKPSTPDSDKKFREELMETMMLLVHYYYKK